MKVQGNHKLCTLTFFLGHLRSFKNVWFWQTIAKCSSDLKAGTHVLSLSSLPRLALFVALYLSYPSAVFCGCYTSSVCSLSRFLSLAVFSLILSPWLVSSSPDINHLLASLFYSLAVIFLVLCSNNCFPPRYLRDLSLHPFSSAVFFCRVSNLVPKSLSDLFFSHLHCHSFLTWIIPEAS